MANTRLSRISTTRFCDYCREADHKDEMYYTQIGTFCEGCYHDEDLGFNEEKEANNG